MIDTLKLSLHIVRRNWTVYKKDLIANISPTVADPLFILLSLGLGLSPFIQEIEGMSYAKFLAPGLIATTAFFTAFFESSYGFYVRMAYEHIFKAMLTTPIGVREILLGEFLWLFIKGAVMALGVGVVLMAVGLIINPWSLIFVPLIGGFLALPCGAIGLIASGYVHNINQFQTVYSFLIAPLYFLSGVFFPIKMQPVVNAVMQASPFYHGVKLMQMSVWGRVDWSMVAYHLGMLTLFTFVFGAWAFKRIRLKLLS